METGLTSKPLIEAKQQKEAGRRREERAEQRGEEEEEEEERRRRGGGEEGILSALLIARCAESTTVECGHCGCRKKYAISHTRSLFFKICGKTTVTYSLRCLTTLIKWQEQKYNKRCQCLISNYIYCCIIILIIINNYFSMFYSSLD